LKIFFDHLTASQATAERNKNTAYEERFISILRSAGTLLRDEIGEGGSQRKYGTLNILLTVVDSPLWITLKEEPQ
jgi:hypothetical protein